MTREELAWLLDGLSLSGDNVIVHADLASFGPVDGGAATVCSALIEAVGDTGTLLMPTFTASETLAPEGEAVPFHGELAVSREIGPVAETFRRLPGVLRSSHPSHSFAAWGRRAREMLSTQRDNNPLGPVKKLSVGQGHVLLLGTTLRSATAIHLAEEQLEVPYRQRRTAWRINTAGYDERVVLENVPGCGHAFDRLEPRLDPEEMTVVRLPRGTACKVAMRYLVRLAMTALQLDPEVFICDRPECGDCAEKRRRIGRLRLAAGAS